MPVLEMVGIEKSFGGVKALRGADFSADAGEIHGLCGENGAGKSTLLKVLSGVHPFGSFGGEVRAFGALQRFDGTGAAQRAGIAIVHQELMLVPELTVAANLLLGREPTRFGLVDDAALEARARELLERFGFGEPIDALTPVGALGIGLQQIVEIVRALSFDAKILVLDEPTAALTSKESDRLMAWLRELKARGTTCLYVSHRMDEIFALCDRVTVLRDGKTACTVVTSEVTPNDVVSAMVGRELTIARGEARELGKVALEVDALKVRLPGVRLEEGAARRFALDGISLTVREGEILGVCGAMGSGRTALLTTLFGCALGEVSGAIRVLGEPTLLRTPREAIARGLALLPEDRKGRGLVLDMTVAENLALPALDSPLVDRAFEHALAARRIRELRIRGDADAPVSTLSGGNQQKVVLGKWLEHPPRVLLLDEPTRGVDVGAREEIYGILESLARRGVAILLASSDLAEVLRLADRVVVLRHGRIAGELPRGTTQEAIVQLSTGASTLRARAETHAEAT